MSPASGRAEYERRMHRVFEFIDSHLDHPLDLPTLAAVAHFSPFHFHRLFAAWTGETLGEYLRRRRIEMAAMRLVAQPRLTVLEVALAVGFGSSEAFARAFKARLGCSPSAWRDRNRGQAVRKGDQAGADRDAEHRQLQSTTKESPMNVKSIDREPATVAYLRYTGPYGEPVSQFWQRTVYPWMVTHALLERPRYGISHDDPGITAPAQCRYDACIELHAGADPSAAAGLPRGTLTTTIPGGRYACARFFGTTEEVGAAWSAVLRDWLPGSGYQLDARPCFEYYPVGARYDAQSGAFECDICIPIAPL